jgi:hypothetical protein
MPVNACATGCRPPTAATLLAAGTAFQQGEPVNINNAVRPK